MKIKSVIKGKVARTAHPDGCAAFVVQQFEQAEATEYAAPQRVLVIGGSSGYGLSIRIAAAAKGASTIAISFERGPSEKGTGTAGWYNNLAFAKEANLHQLYNTNFIGDAFNPELRQKVIDTIRKDLGRVDLVVYSLATGIRPDGSGGRWTSAIKPIGKAVEGLSLDIEKGELINEILEPASEEEIFDTIKVMGGEDWQDWMEELQAADVLADNAKTIAFGYVGPARTYDLYTDGTLGHAKKHLSATAQAMRADGFNAEVIVCKALVTKASVFIPGLTPYIMALYKIMKQKELHEVCIDQMIRLFKEGPRHIDDWEMRLDVQAEVDALLDKMTLDNFKTVLDYDGFMQEFNALNGFGIKGIDYDRDYSREDLKNFLSSPYEAISIEEMALGQTASVSKKVTNEVILEFAHVSGDFNPVHVDEKAAANSRFGKRIAHGALNSSLISTVLGTQLPGSGTIYLAQTIKFKAPVFIDDEITAEVIVTGLKPEKNIAVLKTIVTNQDGVVVAKGEATVMPPKKK